MKKHTSLLALAILAISSAAHAANGTWSNNGTDFNSSSNWTPGLPGNAATDIAIFNSAATVQPGLTANYPTGGIYFQSPLAGGWTLSSANSTLTLLSNSTTIGLSPITSANTSGTNIISAPIILGAASGEQRINQTGAGSLTLSGNISVTNNNVLLGVNTVSNCNVSILGNITGGTGGITVYGGGTLTLTGTNTFTGNISINTGIIRASSIGNIGVASSLGAGTTINIGSTASSSTLVYTGTGDTSNRTINLAGTTGGATIDQSGSGLLKFTSNLTATGLGNKTLTLQGAGNGEIAGVIVNSTGNLTSVTKAGTGTWALSGNNTYTGATAVNGGVLTFLNTSAKSAGTTVTAAAAGSVGLGVGGAGYYSVSDVATLFNTGALSTITLNAASGVGIDTSAGNFTQSTALTAARSLTKLGANTLTLDQANTYTGSTTINAGTLQLGHVNALGNSTTAIVNLNGGTLDFNGIAPKILGLTVGANAAASTTLGGNLTFEFASGTPTIVKVAASKTLILGANTTVNTTNGTLGLQANFGDASNTGTVVLEAGSTLNITGGASRLLQVAGGTLTINGTITTANLNAYAFNTGSTLNWNPEAGSATTTNLFARPGTTINIYNDRFNNLSLGVNVNGNLTSTVTINTGFTKAAGTITMNLGTVANETFTNRLGVDDSTSGGISTSLGGGVTLSTNSTNATNEFYAGQGDTLTLSGNITRTAATANGTVKISGPGTVVFSGGNNTYSDSTVVSTGTLLVNNTSGSATGTGSVSVQGGATLGGTGIIAPAGTNGLTVLATGSIRPGAVGATGNLTINGANTSGVAATFNNGAVFSFDLNASTAVSDRIVLTNGAAGDFTFGGNNTINFNILTGTITNGQTYVLFSGTNPDQFVGVSNLSVGTGLPGTFGTLSTITVLGNDIVLNAIPEPSTWALLAASLTTVMVLRRRRNS